MNKYKENLIIILAITVLFLGSFNSLLGVLNLKTHKYSAEAMIQPSISYGIYPWSIRSIDTQVVSKHWQAVTRDSIKEQVGLIGILGANYVAIGTPYDRVDDMKIWTEEIHAAGMNVWFRSHWNEWEGDEGRTGSMSPEKYLEETYDFIVNNPELFAEGDSFTLCVEPEQVGVGLGNRFLNWDEYKTFLLEQIYVSNQAFEKIGLKGKVYTNWLSVNGWVVENVYDQELVDKIGLITVDHFVEQTSTIGEEDSIEKIVNTTLFDLDRYHKKFNTPIFLGEWGYQIFQDVSDVKQANVINSMMLKLRKVDYLMGMNYWVHMGNSASLFGDNKGSNLTPRLGAEVVRTYYNPLEQVSESP